MLTVASILIAGLMVPISAAEAPALPAGCTGAVTSGDDTIVCATNLEKGVTIDAGAGDDSIEITGDVLEGAAVLGGPGNDRITAYNVGRFVCPAGELGASDANGGILDGGDGDDALTVGGQARPKACDKAIPANLPNGNVGRRAAVRGGAGADSIDVGTLGYVFQPDLEDPSTASVAHGGRVSGDGGPDTIRIGCASLGEKPPSMEFPNAPDGVYGGAGEDTIDVERIVGAADVFGDAFQPIEGAGDDTITVGPMTSGWVRGGPGDDRITAGIMGGASAWVWGDAGDDTLTATDMYKAASLFGGDGDDTLSAESLDKGGYTALANLIGGNGDDTITAGRLDSELSFIRGDGLQGETDPDKGTGKDTIKVGTNQGEIFGGNDDDTITVDDNRKLVDGGAGSDSCAVNNSTGTATTERCEQQVATNAMKDSFRSFKDRKESFMASRPPYVAYISGRSREDCGTGV